MNCYYLYAYRIITDDGGLQLKKTFPVKQKRSHIRSTFCPLMSFRQGACVSEYDFFFSKMFINKLKPLIYMNMGHFLL